MISIAKSMKDISEFGTFCKKGFEDLLSGCVSEDVDPYINEVFENACRAQKVRQSLNSRYYTKMKKMRGAVATHTLNTSASRTTISEDVENGDASKDCKSGTSSETPVPASISNDEDERTAVSNDEFLESGNDTGDIFGATAGEAKAGKAGTGVPVVIAPKPAPAVERMAFGEFKNVYLSIKEGEKLRDVYGNDLDAAINYLDNYLENHPERAKGGKKAYKSHYAVLRKDNWVYQRYMEGKLTSKRYENANNGSKSFAERDREYRAQWLRGELKSDIVRPENMTIEELKENYGFTG